MTTAKKLLRVDLPLDVWAALDREARDKGIKIGVHTKRVLIAHVKGGATPSTAVPAAEPAPAVITGQVAVPTQRKPTPAEWTALNKWLAATNRSPDPSLLITTKSGLLAWAIEQGFRP